MNRKLAKRLVIGAGATIIVGAGAIYWLTRSATQPEVTGAAEPARDATAFAAMADNILAVVHQQESGKDATCWTTVRMIESSSVGRRLAPASEIARVKASGLLLRHLWRRASERSVAGSLSEDHVTAALPADVKGHLDGLQVKLDKPVPTDKVGMADHHRTTDNWRTLLSLVLEAIAAKEVASELAPADPTASRALADASSAMTSRLLQAAGRIAAERDHDEVELDDVQSAYADLVNNWFGGAKLALETVKTGPDPDSFSKIRKISQQTALGKLRALRVYSKLGARDSYENIDIVARGLSDVVRYPLSPEAVKEVSRELRLFTELFFSTEGPFRSDTFANSLEGLLAEKKLKPAKNAAQRVVGVADVFNSVQNIFPTHKLPNGDARVHMVRNIDKEEGDAGEIEEQRIDLSGSSLDAVRDTGIHWLVLKSVIDSKDSYAIAPFAAELLTEMVSEYALFLLKGSVQLAQRTNQEKVTADIVRRLPWKYPLGRFFPDPEREKRSQPGPDAKLGEAIQARYLRPLFRERRELVSWNASCTEGREGFQGFMGSGLAVGDIDQNGLPDLFVAGDGCNRLLRNDGNYRFSDVTDAWGIGELDGTSRHPIFVDINGDGHLDLFVSQSDAPSKIFLQRDGRFIDVTDAYGLTTGTGAHVAHFFDYDRDGDLDLFIGYYGPSVDDTAAPSLDGRNGYPNQLWRNEAGEKFIEVSEKAGVASTAWTLASVAVDIDQDGWLDIWLANDFGRDQVFRNRGDGTFEDIAPKLGVDDRGSGMNASVIDVNHDGRPDIFVSMIEMFSKTLRFVLPHESTMVEVNDRILKSTYFMSGNKLYLSDGRGGFADDTASRLHPKRMGRAWGTVFFDYDNDGDDDAYLVNGWIEKSAFHEQRNQFMVNERGRFYPMSPGLTEKVTAERKFPESYQGSSRAVAAVDLAGTGKQDLVLTDYEGGLFVLPNNYRRAGNWIRVRLEGSGKNRFGVGAAVRVHAPGIEPLFRLANAGGDYLAQSQLPLHFGLGNASQVERIVVRWPSGKESTASGPLKVGQTVVVRE